MTNVLILGANGQIARHVVASLADDTGLSLTLLVRNARKLPDKPPANAHVVQGDVLDKPALAKAVAGQDVVYANLTGEDLDVQAKAVIAATKVSHVKRLIFVTSLGIYDELPHKFQQWNKATIGGAGICSELAKCHYVSRCVR